MGITATLHQVINPTFGGRGFPGGRPVGGTLNTSEGLLSWTHRHDMVVVPTVYPTCPYAEHHLSGSKLLAALDVLGGQVKAASAAQQQTWSWELVLPFKVRAAVFEWVYHLLGPLGFSLSPC